MLAIRVIPCLLLRDGGLIKTVKFKNPTYIGDPINAVKIFNEKEVDELIFLDIDASKKGLPPNFELIKDLATECFMPFAYGGGVTTTEQIKKILELGVEKVVINHSSIENTQLVEKASKFFGSSTIIGAIDIARDFFGSYYVYSHVKNKKTKITPIEHALKLQQAGAGELFLNFVNLDGTYQGFDISMIKEITEKVSIPVIACGGASKLSDIGKVVKSTHVSGVAAGSIFVYKGPHKAVLISYPSQKELAQELNS